MEHSCKLMERKKEALYELLSHRHRKKWTTVAQGTKAPLSCHIQHPTNPTLLPQLQRVWKKRLLFARKDNVFFRTRKSNKKDWLGKLLLT